MCIVRSANNINRNVYMHLNTRIFPTTGYARVLLFMFIRLELGGMVQDVYFSIIPTQCFYCYFGDFDWSVGKIKLFLHFDKNPCVGIFDTCKAKRGRRPRVRSTPIDNTYVQVNNDCSLLG